MLNAAFNGGVTLLQTVICSDDGHRTKNERYACMQINIAFYGIVSTAPVQRSSVDEKLNYLFP